MNVVSETVMQPKWLFGSLALNLFMSLSVALKDKHSTLKVKVIKKSRMGKATQKAKNENQNHLSW